MFPKKLQTNKPPKPKRGNEIDEVTGPTNPKGNDHEGADPKLMEAARQVFFK